MSTMDDWQGSRHEANTTRFDPTGEREEQADPQYRPSNDGSVTSDWEAERHDLNTEHELGG